MDGTPIIGSIVLMLAHGKVSFKSKFLPVIELHVGNGDKSLPRLFSFTLGKNCPVSALFSFHDNWNVQFRRNLREEEICDVSSLLTILRSVSLVPNSVDHRSWSLSFPGFLTASSFSLG